MIYKLKSIVTGIVSATINQLKSETRDLSSTEMESVYKRNKLMVTIFIIFSSLDILLNVYYYPIILKPLIITASIACLVGLFFLYKPKLALYGMYSIVIIAHLPFIAVAYVDIDIINYFFLIVPLIMASVYNRIGPIIVSGIISCLTFTYFYFYYFDKLFYFMDKEDVAYYILMTVFITMFLILSTRLTESFFHQLKEKEQNTFRQLVSTKEYLEAYFNNTTDSIAVYDLKGKVIQVNRSFVQKFQVDEKNIVGSKTDFLPFTNEEYMKSYFYQIKDEGSFSFEAKSTTRKEKQVEVSVTVTPIKNEKSEIIAFVLLMKDITEKKLTEEALLQSEKLSVIGELAAGVAHEIRNPVTVLQGFVQLLSQQNPKQEIDYYSIMKVELERINQITNEFMALAKPHAVIMNKQDIKKLIKEVTSFLESEALLHQVELNVHFNDTTPIFVKCEYNQIKQVLLNVIKNSIEAIPQSGGKIDLSLEESERHIGITIMDDGKGIPKDLVDKIGQPFFTTKETGTGLGLMVSMKIIENHGGSFSIKGLENKGTIVRIILPKNE